MNKLSAALCGAVMLASVLAACSSRPVHAPVLDRVPPVAAEAPRPAPPSTAPADARPASYLVKRGDTLYSIALDHGLDYREFAVWNNLDDPNLIRVGQELRLKPPPGMEETTVRVSPVSASERVETRPLGAQGPARSPLRPPSADATLISEPRARKLPYSAENLALIQGGSAASRPAPKIETEPAPAQAVTPKPDQGLKADAGVDDEDMVDWGWPVRGKIIAGFSEATNKGVDIAGKLGDPVIASGSGRVVYSGSGLRGYGKLVIIKHNKTYLSAYAHNREILVKEGQNVVKGQKIAEIGSTDTDAPKLHFEIRKFGKPIDPSKFLPPT